MNRRTGAITLALGIAVASLTGCPPIVGPETEDVSGTWTFFKGHSDDGLHGTLILNQDGGKVTGTMTGIYRAWFIYDGFVGISFSDYEEFPDSQVTGTVSGDQVTIEFSTDERIKVKGTVKGSTMNGDVWYAEKTGI